ncbi:helix-turn-helix domain-containing protein [Candidatus Woesebacteria bacterium]|nr:helix-turn-helix domain-containing protein [Candidatus Woesebacteria bacterium]
MRTKTIGEALKEERVSHRLLIEDLSKRTRIRVNYLEALEENRFSELPSTTFVKGYIKTYAKIFGFDHKPLIAMLRRDYKESAKGRLVPREFIKPIFKRRSSRTSITLVMVALISIFLSLVGYIGIQWHNLNKPPELIITSPGEQDVVSSKVVIEGKTIPDAVLLVNNQPISLQPSGEFKSEILIPTEGIAIITIESRDRRGKVNTVQRSVNVQF